MTPEQRRAHLVLHGQTLLDEWTEHCKLKTEGDKLWDEGTDLWDEGSKLWDEGSKLRDEGTKLWDKGERLRAESYKFWYDAVANEFGTACTITWKSKDCLLGCGERYAWIP